MAAGSGLLRPRRHPSACVCEHCFARALPAGDAPRAPTRTHTRTTPLESTTSPMSAVEAPVPVPSIEEAGGRDERADLRVELDRYAAGDTAPRRIEAPPLPTWATRATRLVFADLLLCSGLLRAAGDDGTVMYGVDWAAARLRLSSSTVSVALRSLRCCGAIRQVKELPRMGTHRAGLRVYTIASPGDGFPARPRGAETARPGRIDERQEVGNDVTVREAIPDDSWETRERHRGLRAGPDHAAEAGGSRQTVTHTPQAMPGIGAARRPRNAFLD